jgi:hypothetical protein
MATRPKERAKMKVEISRKRKEQTHIIKAAPKMECH